MTTNDNNQDGSATGNGGGEGGTDVVEKPSISDAELAVLREKAEKADKLETEVGSLKRDLKKVKKALDPDETPEKTTQQSSEPDYSKIAFLNSIDVKHPDDQKVVVDEAERLKLPLTDVANMEHVKAALAKNLAKRETQDGMPDKHGRTGGSASKDVEYYLTHPDEVPTDPALHSKLIDAKMKQETQGSKWGIQKFSS